jgi:hypothetical protein
MGIVQNLETGIVGLFYIKMYSEFSFSEKSLHSCGWIQVLVNYKKVEINCEKYMILTLLYCSVVVAYPWERVQFGLKKEVIY